MSKDVVIFNITWLNGKAVSAKPVKLKKSAAENVLTQIDPSNQQPEWCTEGKLPVFGLTVEVQDEKPAKKPVEAPAKPVSTPPVGQSAPAKPAIKSVEESEKQ